MIEENKAIEKATIFLLERYKRQPPPFFKAYLNRKGEKTKFPGLDVVFVQNETYWTIWFYPAVKESDSYITVHVFMDGKVEQPAEFFDE
ncbi:hypothetical protein [Enterovibrio norvegicus]|uniref:hypothetical protein n=1 Tax=Enterovibrio norvegicus TaxID=188144 RepID=UPI000C82140E|nr:hypothetical protein [Enterovibrio norvegicus]PMN74159.1 hypothetical protein BCT27_00850 [Enterovibrio norvegicus]